jgi:hypothetical protein
MGLHLKWAQMYIIASLVAAFSATRHLKLTYPSVLKTVVCHAPGSGQHPQAFKVRHISHFLQTK